MRKIFKTVLVLAAITVLAGYVVGTWIQIEQTFAYACGYMTSQTEMLERKSGTRLQELGIELGEPYRKCEKLKAAARAGGFDPNGNVTRP